MVVVLLGVLAAAVVPRLSGTSEADRVALLEQTRSALRHARDSAVAARRQVCVRFSPTSLTLQVAATFGGACSLDLAGPGQERPYVVSGRRGARYAGSPPDFSFTPLGVPSPDATYTVAVEGGAGSVVVEAGTGHVH